MHDFQILAKTSPEKIVEDECRRFSKWYDFCGAYIIIPSYTTRVLCFSTLEVKFTLKTIV